MDKQSRICLSIVVSSRFYAVRSRNLFVRMRKNILLVMLFFYRYLGGIIVVCQDVS